ncbi:MULTISPECIES: helix-turn-helix transcriptional regulator [unclassified Undibacterium]|uniref:helix-turn-helix transcriptional regulator n=1 Tax=unclassified Undibacterium TaxID=2630295 RepID=UPI002AC8FDCE|nr:MULTISPECIES: AraC family transcriptional regulator ligand-binding domain-containing protein [unclassified Undibacterium]MEB0138837.1 AraC family transcriptional regulator ligand-binding domain-containing protein [Undibacterium sp. CCC2.1]MEB0172301.1 AraC family transcriptional regulator ligand-binding domain-containing protein [Undibacterium sp. CCC1.1]MEB0176082.1 AraC family transcriptional regulator ligand-binding domain-containing protein [Undibacterium sp. CCC3.4]MEB0216924.1 AraC fam
MFPAAASLAFGTVLSVRDAVFPAHPFSGLLAIARERAWPLQNLFPSLLEPGHSHITYLEARAGVLCAQQQGLADLGIWSGERKSLAQLGLISAGIGAHDTLLEALKFALEYQMVAGSMLDLQLQIDAHEASLCAYPLFDDRELEDFLAVDHLLTAFNVARQLCGPAFRLLRLELRVPQLRRLSLYEQSFAAPVKLGAARCRIVFPRDLLQHRLAQPDQARVLSVRQHCQDELSAAGVLGRRSLLHILVGLDCQLHSVADSAAALNISPRSLHRLLAREGSSYFQISENLRIVRAKHLLQSGEAIERIAEALGYSDTRSWRRAFKRATGSTPGAYRAGLIGLDA